jgi:type IV secretory pathway VirB2 component (pilin)
MAQVARRRWRLSIIARLAIVQEVAARFADSHGVTEVVGPIRSSLDGGLVAAALVVNVVSSDGNGLDTLYDFPKIFKGRFLACLAACPT